MKRLCEINVGDYFGQLQVISDSELIGTRLWYEVLCSCGNKFKTTGSRLRIGKTTRCISCAMKYRETTKSHTLQIDQMFHQKVVIRCRDSGLKYDLTLQDFEDIIGRNCYYCNAKPAPSPKFLHRKYVNTTTFNMNGIDRLDNTLGYVKDNCVACCKVCNAMKKDMTESDFLDKVAQIYKFKRT